jgi:hypothetical protein
VWPHTAANTAGPRSDPRGTSAWQLRPRISATLRTLISALNESTGRWLLPAHPYVQAGADVALVAHLNALHSVISGGCGDAL